MHTRVEPMNIHSHLASRVGVPCCPNQQQVNLRIRTTDNNVIMIAMLALGYVSDTSEVVCKPQNERTP